MLHEGRGYHNPKDISACAGADGRVVFTVLHRSRSIYYSASNSIARPRTVSSVDPAPIFWVLLGSADAPPFQFPELAAAGEADHVFPASSPVFDLDDEPGRAVGPVAPGIDEYWEGEFAWVPGGSGFTFAVGGSLVFHGSLLWVS